MYLDLYEISYRLEAVLPDVLVKSILFSRSAQTVATACFRTNDFFKKPKKSPMNWATFVRTFATKNFQISPNLVTLQFEGSCVEFEAKISLKSFERDCFCFRPSGPNHDLIYLVDPDLVEGDLMLQSFVDIEYQVGKSKRGTVVKQWRLTPVDPGSNLVKGSFYSQLFRKRNKEKDARNGQI